MVCKGPAEPTETKGCKDAYAGILEIFNFTGKSRNYYIIEFKQTQDYMLTKTKISQNTRYVGE